MDHSASYVALSNATIRANLASTTGANALPLAGIFLYLAPTPAGHWMPFGSCLVSRQPCLPYLASTAGCVRDLHRCALTPDGMAGHGDGSGPVTPDGCTPVMATQRCDWSINPWLISQQVFRLPLHAIEEDIPNACAAGVLGSSDPRHQSSSTCRQVCPAGIAARTPPRVVRTSSGRSAFESLPRQVHIAQPQ
jgi:hypothetical protein